MVSLEYEQLLNEIDRIAATTEFNGTSILSGAGGEISFQINTKNSGCSSQSPHTPFPEDATAGLPERTT